MALPTKDLSSRKCDEKSTEVTIILGGRCKVGSSVVVRKGKIKLMLPRDMVLEMDLTE